MTRPLFTLIVLALAVCLPVGGSIPAVQSCQAHGGTPVKGACLAPALQWTRGAQ